jgi:hypothetical protein
MTFATECISLKDQESHRFTDFEMQFFTINPQDDWAIDRWQNPFPRAIRPAARGLGPGSPKAWCEKDFPFHWRGCDYFACLRIILGVIELQNLPGEILIGFNPHAHSEEVLRIDQRHTGEMHGPKARSSASKRSRQQVLPDLEYAFAFNFIGVFGMRSSKEAELSRNYIAKGAREEVTA